MGISSGQTHEQFKTQVVELIRACLRASAAGDPSAAVLKMTSHIEILLNMRDDMVGHHLCYLVRSAVHDFKPNNEEIMARPRLVGIASTAAKYLAEASNPDLSARTRARHGLVEAIRRQHEIE